MATINTIFLPESRVLTVVADAFSNGQIYRVISGQDSSELQTIAASSTIEVGPFGIGKDYAICSKAGLLTTSIGDPVLGGGKVLQVVQIEKTDEYAATVSDMTAVTGMSLIITPTSVNSKILVRTNINVSTSIGGQIHLNLNRDGSPLAIGDVDGTQVQCSFATSNDGNGGGQQCTSWEYLDSPATTSELTYNVDARAYESDAQPVYVNRAQTDTSTPAVASPVSIITAVEIEG